MITIIIRWFFTTKPSHMNLMIGKILWFHHHPTKVYINPRHRLTLFDQWTFGPAKICGSQTDRTLSKFANAIDCSGGTRPINNRQSIYRANEIKTKSRHTELPCRRVYFFSHTRAHNKYNNTYHRTTNYIDWAMRAKSQFVTYRTTGASVGGCCIIVSTIARRLVVKKCAASRSRWQP